MMLLTQPLVAIVVQMRWVSPSTQNIDKFNKLNEKKIGDLLPIFLFIYNPYYLIVSNLIKLVDPGLAPAVPPVKTT